MVNELLTPIKLRIFNCLELQESDVVLGDLNLFGWVIFKSDSKLNEILNEPLANYCAVDENGYWERLVNTDYQRKCCSLLISKVFVFKRIMIFHFIFLKPNSNMIFLLLCII